MTFRHLFSIFIVVALLGANTLYAQKKMPKKPVPKAPISPKKTKPNSFFIDLHCKHHSSISDTTIDQQKVYLKHGQFFATIKLIDQPDPNINLAFSVSYPFNDTILLGMFNQFFIAEPKTRIVYAVTDNYYFEYIKLQKKPLVIPEKHKRFALKTGKEYKAIIHQIVDFDTIVSGGRGTVTGFHATEIVDLKKPFSKSIVNNKDSALQNPENYICLNDPKMLGFFVDSATSDTIRVSISAQKPGLRILYKAHKSKNYSAIKPMYHFYPMNSVIGTNQPLWYSKNIPYSNDLNFFYYNGDCWILPGQCATADNYQGGIVPQGILQKPLIPAKFFKKLQNYSK